MRRETVERQDFRVLHFTALCSVGRNRKHFLGEFRTTFVLVVLLQESRIDLLLLDLAVGLVRPAFFHHYAGDANVRIPNREVGDRSSLGKRKQVLAFEYL